MRKIGVRRFVERFYPLSFGLLGVWLANKFLPQENLDLFIPGIFLSFFGGVLLIISQKYLTFIICGNEKIEKFVHGMRQSGAITGYYDYFVACECWVSGLIFVSLTVALSLFTWPPLRLIGAFFLFGSVAAFHRINHLYGRLIDNYLRDDS